MTQSYVLVVGEPEVVGSADRALSDDLRVLHCPGASAVSCPAVHGRPCGLREEAAVAVVFFSGEHEFHAPGQWQCLTAAPSAAVAVLEGSTTPVRGSRGFSIVGAKCSPERLGEAIDLSSGSDVPGA